MRRTIVTLVLAVIVVTSAAYLSANAFLAGKSSYRQVDAKTAKTIMAKNTDYVILDVRTQEEYNEKHIPGAVLIPDYEIFERAEQELPNKARLVLVYCRSGNRSKKASQILADLGYTNVVEFGGIKDWPYETEPKK